MNQILAGSARPAAAAVDTRWWSPAAAAGPERPHPALPAASPAGGAAASRALMARQIEALAYRRAQESEPCGLEPTLAHDLNNLLTSIVGHTELARRKLAPGDPSREHLEQIEAAVEQVRRLVTRSSGAGRRKGRRKPRRKLQEVVREAADLVRATLPANVHLCLRLDEEAPALPIDEGQIHRMILNLARNGIQAMARGGGELGMTLEQLSCDAAGEPRSRLHRGLLLEVRDQGEGIAPENSRRIFEPRFTTRPGSGSGWGLVSVARIAQDHGAVLGVETRVGVGSRFRVVFPVP